jgi:Flp pilus assembly pilin Flp
MLGRVHGRMVLITRSECGGSLVEYVLLVACIALASFGAASLFGTSLGQLFQAVAAVMP